MNKDYFQEKSKTYEKDSNRVNNVENIANAIKRNIKFEKTMHIMDFGSGTGIVIKENSSAGRKNYSG